VESVIRAKLTPYATMAVKAGGFESGWFRRHWISVQPL